MKLLIKKSTLLKLLDYLYVKKLFPFSRVLIKNGKIYSSHYSVNRDIYRYVRCTDIQLLEDGEVAFECNPHHIRKFIDIAKGINEFKLSYKQNEPQIHLQPITKDGTIVHNLKVIPLNILEVTSKPFFRLKNKVPFIQEAPLDIHIRLPYKSLHETTKWIMKNNYSDYFTFKVDEKNKLICRIGGGYLEDEGTWVPFSWVYTNRELAVSFNRRKLLNVLRTFQNSIDIRLRSNFPGWFVDKSRDFSVGILLLNSNTNPL